MSVSLLLDMAVGAHPDRVLVGDRRDGLTATDLSAAAAAAAAGFLRAGAGSVGYLGPHGPDMAVALFGAARAGIPLVPLNFRLAQDRLERLVARLECPVVLTDHPTRWGATGWPVLDLADWRTSLSEHLSTEEVAELAGDAMDDAVAALIYTSGTTSEPKGAILRHRHLVAYVLQTVDLGSAGAEEALLVSVPPYHIAGIGTVLTNVFAGRRLVFLPQFEAAQWLTLAEAEQVTHAMVVPTMLARIVEALTASPRRLPHLRSIAYGGARMPSTILRRALGLLPHVDFTNAYGLTETSSTVAVLGPEDHRAALASTDPAVRARLGSAGRLAPGVEGSVRDPQGRRAPIGELWLRGPQVAGEYSGSGSTLTEDGWFRTRDRARFDADGFLFIEGRADDIIIRGGENIAPAEIEDVLVEHPEVKEVAVIGVPDEEWGSRIVAVVVAQPSASLGGEELREWVRARLRGSRTPDDVVFRETLPYTPTGKLLRRELAASVMSR